MPFTEVTLEDSPDTHGSRPNQPFRLYNTAGPGSDPHRGLPPLRASWVAERGDVEEYAGSGRDLGDLGDLGDDGRAAVSATPKKPAPVMCTRVADVVAVSRAHHDVLGTGRLAG